MQPHDTAQLKYMCTFRCLQANLAALCRTICRELPAAVRDQAYRRFFAFGTECIKELREYWVELFDTGVRLIAVSVVGGGDLRWCWRMHAGTWPWHWCTHAAVAHTHAAPAGRSNLHGSMAIYKAARFFHPGRVRFVDNDDDSIRAAVKEMPAIAQATNAEALIQERARYLELAADCTTDTDAQDFFRTHAPTIPSIADAARIVMTYHTNSTDCERVFSILQYVSCAFCARPCGCTHILAFDMPGLASQKWRLHCSHTSLNRRIRENQSDMLDDMVEAQLMAQYNSRPPLTRFDRSEEKYAAIDWGRAYFTRLANNFRA